MTLKGKRVQLFDEFLSHILVPLQDSMHPYKEAEAADAASNETRFFLFSLKGESG